MELLPLLFVFILMWLLMVRPAQKRAKAAQAMQASLQVGDKVMLTSGIFGTVVELVDGRAVLSIAAGTEIEVVRAAIAEVVREEQTSATTESAETTGIDLDKGEDA
ncbi:preprotein translocase subunit YajC [Nocardioides yefusunii]|uniref:Preprotein translocase subunit YajC n=1 Tax=Nocardioides yefusunii TaxID=2500546 RepID=A0ABW1QZ17_9ACTN|nr:preprotein translocase subunit YajC [Nocardioides yefusunii]